MRLDLSIIASSFVTVCLAIALATLAFANDPNNPEAHGATTRLITVDPSVFGDVYPAVWFSPSTGEIIALADASERPPHIRYEIWIEPRDPEFAFLNSESRKGQGFQMIGRGQAVFDDTMPYKHRKHRPDLQRAMTDDDGLVGAVFSCSGHHGNCRIMITAWDKEKQLLRFAWKPIP